MAVFSRSLARYAARRPPEECAPVGVAQIAGQFETRLVFVAVMARGFPRTLQGSFVLCWERAGAHYPLPPAAIEAAGLERHLIYGCWGQSH
jgi:hypothetical protein